MKCVSSVLLWLLLAIVCLAFTIQLIMYQSYEVHVLRMSLLGEADILQLQYMVLKQLSVIYDLWFQYPSIQEYIK